MITDPDHAAAAAMYLVLRNGVRTDVPWEDVPADHQAQLVHAWRVAQQAHAEALRARDVVTATSKREPEIKLEVFPDGEFQAVCDCGWKSDKSLDQEFIYNFAASHQGVTGHEFAPGGTPIEDGSGD